MFNLRGRVRRHLRLERRVTAGAKETLGAGSIAVRSDVSNLPDLGMMFATIGWEFGHLDCVFVNAGYSEFLWFEDATEQSFDRVIAAKQLLAPGQGWAVEAHG